MKILMAILTLATLSGCSTYSTHLRTGCVWSCAEIERQMAQGQPNYYGSDIRTGTTTYNLPSGSYQANRVGNTVTVIQTSKGR